MNSMEHCYVVLIGDSQLYEQKCHVAKAILLVHCSLDLFIELLILLVLLFVQSRHFPFFLSGRLSKPFRLAFV